MNELQRPPEVQAVLDEHLDAVERVLLDVGLSRTERQAICDAIQTQAADMLESRGIVAPTVEDARTVVAEMDPPGSYRESAAPAPTPAEPARLHPAALWSVILPVAAFLLMFLPFGPKGEAAGLTFLGVAGLATVALGIPVIVSVRRRPTRFCGVGWAAIGMCVLPAVFLHLLAIYLWGPALESWVLRDAMQREQAMILIRVANAVNLETSRRTGVRNHAQSQPATTAAVPFPLPTSRDRWLLEHRKLIEAGAILIALLPALGLSFLAPWLIYRQCRPPEMLRSDVRD